MSAERARERAEAALKLARDPRTIAADREAAIAGARRIIERNGLDPDSFDFPDRPATKPPPASRFREDLFARPRSPFFDGSWTPDDVEDVFTAFARHMQAARRRETSAASDMGDAFAYAYATRRAANPNRSGAAMNRLRADLAVKYLWRRLVRVYQAANDGEARRWIIPEESEVEYSDEGICEVAQRKGWDGRDPAEIDDPSAEVMARAIAYLWEHGVDVELIEEGPDLPPQFRCEGEVKDARRVLFTARLYGFEI